MSSTYQPSPTDIAIIGMSVRVSGARNPAEFWKNLRSGTDSIRRLSIEELLAAGVDPADLAKPNYVRAAAVLEDLASFDAGFFGFSRKDAAIMDPQHRHFLECCWEALEHAAHVPQSFPGVIGVFGGCGMNAYFMFNLLTNRELMDSTGLFLIRHTGNDKDFLCTRVSYQFNLKGPSISVQTACSTSLVAVHMACQSLINGECDMALAGGVTIEIPHGRGYLYEEGEILSHDGYCRSFDAGSTGTVFGSGVGVVALRRMQDAIDDGDNILAVIRGSAINNDGAGKVGYLAPGLDGQAAVYAETLSVSGVDAESIGYIETHGTGTQVGDPIEVEALAQAFRRFTTRTGFCAIGSVKTNIGHLDTAAGVVGLIKTVQALRHREIPPSLHFEKPNSLIAFEETPFYVNAALRDWPAGAEPRRAGVSSLGVGGTNAHIILEEAPPVEEMQPSGEWQLLPLSAKSEVALEGAAGRLADVLRETPRRLEDIAFTLQYGRGQFAHRRIVISRNPAAAAAALASRDTQKVFSGVAEKDPSVAFLFAGGGAQYPGMGEGLYREHALYRQIIDEGFSLFQDLTGEQLQGWLFPSDLTRKEARRYMQRPLFGLPALFLTQYATARLWISMGVRPAALVGHSAGAYAAACIAETMTLREGLSIIIERGRLFETLPAGAMLSVALSELELGPLLGPRLSVAAVNSPELLVASGPVEEIVILEQRLREKGIEGDRVHINVAAHSRMLDPILDPFRAAVARLRLQPPKVPLVSCFKGTWITAEEACSADFWTNELRHTVRFSDAARTLLADGSRVFIEAGPGQTLSAFTREQPAFTASHATIPSLRNFKTQADDNEWFLGAVGRAWTLGAAVDWRRMHGDQPRRRVELPGYAWDHQDYWIEAGSHPAVSIAAPNAPVALRKHADPADWFYRPVWRRMAAAPVAALSGSGPWLVLNDGSELAVSLLSLLRTQGESALNVSPGDAFSGEGEAGYRIRPGVKEDYERLFAAMAAENCQPRRILHLWSKREDSFTGLLLLLQGLVEIDASAAVQVVVVTEHLQPLEGTAIRTPLQALSLGPVRVGPQELPELNCIAIDIERWDASMAHVILNEAVASPAAVAVCAIRGGARWEEEYESLAMPESGELPLREGGVYLITGGQGGIGLTIARQFAASGKKPKLVLLGRSAMAPDDARRASIGQMEEAGAEVLLLAADIADRAEAATALETILARFGPVHGVLHAAGVIDDGPLSSKTVASAQAVLRPKVDGARVLADLFDPEALDFFILFSSTSALLGLAGQIDYGAANAFLDAFAASRKGVRVVDWSMWHATGMTSRFAGSSFPLPLNTGTDWVVADHRIRSGPAVLPGSAYAGLARRAALETGESNEGAVRISNLVFLAPLIVPDGESVPARVSLRNGKFSVSTARHGAVVTHATAEVSLQSGLEPSRHDLESIRQRCTRRSQQIGPDNPYTSQGDYIDFGKRWDVMRRASFGDGEALLELELPEAFRGDVLTHPLHPALFDWATSGGLPLAPGYALNPRLHVPMSVAEIVMYRPMPARILSHVRLSSSGSGDYDTIVFDAIICDEDGWEIAAVNGFTLRRMEKPIEFLPGPDGGRGEPDSPLDAIMESAVLPEEGVAALARILASPAPGRIVVSPLPLRKLLQSIQPQRIARSAIAGEQDQAPEDEVERWLVENCRDLLGVPRIRPEDDFFALGGHSLVAVRLFIRIKKKYRLDLGMSTLFEARPLAKLAALIRDRVAATGDGVHPADVRWSPVVRIQAGTAGKPTLFLVHGVGGNVVGFEPLVKRLGRDYPVFAIQSVGIDGKLRPLTSVDEMAALYVDDIRRVQPRGPYQLIGYSFGGLIAYEMAQRLVTMGEKVALLGMFDTLQHSWLLSRMPHVGAFEKGLSLFGRFRRHGRQLLLGPDRLGYIREKTRQFYDNVAKLLVLDTSLRLGVRVDPEVRLFHFLNTRAAFQYVPKHYSGRIVLFRAKERSADDPYPEHLGWEGLAGGGLEIHEVPGTHLTMGEEPHVEALAAAVRRCLGDGVEKGVWTSLAPT